MRLLTSVYLLFILFPVVSGHDNYPRNLSADVIHYEFSLTLNDSTDRIEGRALVDIRFTRESDSITLDLNGINGKGKGMLVNTVSIRNESLKWKQQAGKIVVYFNNPTHQNDTLGFLIEYSGIPADGLIISKNKFGSRTFFADHWPDRAHDYLPCVDHPYDKASVDFIITAPNRYKVVASGTLIEESDLPGNMKLTHWSESSPLATKVMTFGAAQFAVKLAGNINNIPVWSWVFPENRTEGFSDYSVALKPLAFYNNLIGNYPYEKLANVQSKTIYGGLENAGTIFYAENSVTGRGKAEGLIAHEIAHQWFGDCVTEAEWFHIWLSEGFATYMTSLYFESISGSKRLESDMQFSRVRVLRYYERNPRPLVDTTIKNLMDLLSINSYQKGAWVLHMLRNEIGYDVFIKGMRLYYERFYNSNALSDDFIKVMEEVSGRNLETFFRQWLYVSGQPELKIWQGPGEKKGTIDLFIEQKQEHLFEFSLDLRVKDTSKEKMMNIFIKERITKIPVPAQDSVVVIPDPNVNLLYKLL